MDVDIPTIVESVRALVSSSAALAKAVRESSLPAWVGAPGGPVLEGSAGRHRCAELIEDLFYHGDEDGRRTRKAYGIVGVDASTLSLAETVLADKDQVRGQIRHYLAETGRRKERAELESAVRDCARDWLGYTGLQRINLNHAYRGVVILHTPPRRLGFCWYHGRSLKRVSVEEVVRAVRRRQGEGDASYADEQILKALSGLPKDKVLVRVQQLRPSVRANGVWQNTEGMVVRRTLLASLPFLAPMQGPEDMPALPREALRAAEMNVSGRRLRRSDRQIEEQPLVQSLRLHQYANDAGI